MSFREDGGAAIEWVASYLERLREVPVLAQVEPGDLRSALAEGLAHPGPALIELITDPNVLAVPSTIKADQVKGFALASTKVVLGGGVGRMLDLARANLRYGHPAAVL